MMVDRGIVLLTTRTMLDRSKRRISRHGNFQMLVCLWVKHPDLPYIVGIIENTHMLSSGGTA
jgi:hypothetical protein